MRSGLPRDRWPAANPIAAKSGLSSAMKTKTGLRAVQAIQGSRPNCRPARSGDTSSIVAWGIPINAEEAPTISTTTPSAAKRTGTISMFTSTIP